MPVGELTRYPPVTGKEIVHSSLHRTRRSITSDRLITPEVLYVPGKTDILPRTQDDYGSHVTGGGKDHHSQPVL